MTARTHKTLIWVPLSSCDDTILQSYRANKTVQSCANIGTSVGLYAKEESLHSEDLVDILCHRNL